MFNDSEMKEMASWTKAWSYLMMYNEEDIADWVWKEKEKKKSFLFVCHSFFYSSPLLSVDELCKHLSQRILSIHSCLFDETSKPLYIYKCVNIFKY